MRKQVFGVIFVLLFAGALVGCSTSPRSVGNPATSSQSLHAEDEASGKLGLRIAEGYGMVASMRVTAANLLKAKKINVATAKRIQAYCDEARKILDAAEQTLLQDPKDSKERVTAFLLNVSYLLSQSNEVVMNQTQGIN